MVKVCTSVARNTPKNNNKDLSPEFLAEDLSGK